MPPAPAIVSLPLVSPQVSWSSCDRGIGVATTSAHILLGMTTSQSIALSAPLLMVPSSNSKQLVQSLAPLLSCQAPVSSLLMCDSRLGFIVLAASDRIPHRLVQRIWNGEFVEMRELLADNISLYNQLKDFVATPVISAPVYERFPCFHRGCTALQRTWQSLHQTLGLVRCWPTAGSFLRHTGWLA